MTQSGDGHLVPPWPNWLPCKLGPVVDAKQALMLSTQSKSLCFGSNEFWKYVSRPKESCFQLVECWKVWCLDVGGLGLRCPHVPVPIPPSCPSPRLVNYEGSAGGAHRCIICAALWASLPPIISTKVSQTLLRVRNFGHLGTPEPSAGTLDTPSNNWGEFGPAAGPDSTTATALWSNVIHPLLKSVTLPSRSTLSYTYVPATAINAYSI